MRERTEKCASCSQYRIDDAARDGGLAMCDIREVPYRWDSRACVIYDRAGDINRRAPLVKQLMETTTQKGNDNDKQ